MNDADLEALELADASRWAFCSGCGDEVRRSTLDDAGRCQRCTPAVAVLRDGEAENLEELGRWAETFADEHAGGQLRLGVAGVQRELLPLEDERIPTTPAAVDVDAAPATVPAPIEGQTELYCADVAVTLGDPLAEVSTEQAAELHRARLEGRTTRRERLERKAEKRREWADSREAKSRAAFETSDRIAGMIPMGQPILVGHHSEKRHRRDVARIENGMRRGLEHAEQAREHASKADGLDEQLAGAIYDDDPDAIELLEAKLAKLEAERESRKAANAAYRREHGAELRSMSAYERGQAVPFPSYSLQNLGGNISRTRDRLARLKRAAVTVAAGGRGYGRQMLARFSSSCADCGETIEKGSAITYYKLTREAVHAECVKKEA